jgi:hypothetical protein
MDLTRIAERLEVRFGLGSNPPLRTALYRRLEILIRDQGEGPYQLVSQVAADAIGKKDEGRYFAYSVVRRLREHGYLNGVEL